MNKSKDKTTIGIDADLSTEQAIQDAATGLIADRRAFMTLAGLGAGAALLTSRTASSDPSPQGDSSGDGLTLEDIKSVEKVMNLEYPANRRQDVLDNIESTQQAAAMVRGRTFDNGLPPAPAFDPRLPGKTYPSEANQLVTEEAVPYLPASEDDIAFASVRDQSHWLKSGQITSAALTKIYLKRIKLYAPTLKCFVTVTEELALSQAKLADDALKSGTYKGPLHGIPYALKDLADTKGIPTTWGAEPFKDRVPDRDAAIVDLLRDAGAVLIGKASSGALAIGDVWFGGVTRNPWNSREGSSGSSAGPASAVAAGLASFAIGTETLGSIISPANRCGLAGLRPSFGRVSRHGLMALAWSLDKAGPLCRTAEDTAIILSVINGYDPRDASSIETGFDFNARKDLSDIKVGYIPAAFDGDSVSETDKRALEAAKNLAIDLHEVTLPDLPYSGMLPIIRAESSAAFDALVRSNDIDRLKFQGPSSRSTSFRVVRMLSAVDYINMERLRRQVMIAMDRIFSEVDVIIGPNYARNMLLITNYTGTPQITIRAGFEHRRSRPLYGEQANGSAETYRLPVGFSVFGGLFKDAAMIRVAVTLEKALGAAHARPKLG